MPRCSSPFSSRRRRSGRWIGLWAVLAAGCGGPAASTGPTFPDEVVLHSGPRVVVLPRPMGTLVEVGLWLDAGARDAEPSAVATLAGWVAAQAAGSDVHAAVFPDGTVFRTQCTTEALDDCVEKLGRALGLRRVSAAQLDRAKQRYRQAQQATRTDAERSAQRLGLMALLGDDSPGFLPLHGEAKTVERIQTSKLERYLRDHYGPRRALLLAAGDLATKQLAQAADRKLAKLPQARDVRAQRSLEISTGGVRVAFDASHRVTLALAAGGLDEAAALARSMASPKGLPGVHVVQGACSDGGIRTQAVPVRGGALVLAQIECSDLEAAVASLGFEAVRARLELTPLRAEDLAGEDDPGAALERIGLRWVAGELTRAPFRASRFADSPVGIGVATLRGGVRSDAKGEDVARVVLEKQLDRVRSEVAALARGKTRGDMNTSAASVVARNQTRLEVRRRIAAKRMAVAVGFLGGTGTEPASLHGRTALLAQLASTSCRSFGEQALETRLQELNATLESRVTPGYWGIILRAPRAHWAQAVELALACALEPNWTRDAVLKARLRLRQRLDHVQEIAWFRAQSSRILTPIAPGLVAPWGTGNTLANVEAAELEEVWRAGRKGSRLAVALVGDVPVDDAVAHLARRVSGLPTGALPAPALPGPKQAGPLAADRQALRPLAVIGWRMEGSVRGGGAGPRAYAAAMAKSLAAEPHLNLRWHDGGIGTWGAWATLAVEVDAKSLAQLPDLIAKHTRALTAEQLKHGVREQVKASTGARQLAIGEPGLEAEQLVLTRLDQPEATTEQEPPSLQVALALRGATPGFVIAGAGMSRALTRDAAR